MNRTLKKSLVIGTTAVVVGAGFWAKQAFYTVSRVIDGDTFETTEHQLIRLAGVDAPELEYCGGKESKQELEKLILGKRIFLKSVYKDPFQRLVSWVYTSHGSVELKMVQSGNAYYHNRQQEKAKYLQVATQKAKEDKIGIFSSKCSPETNLDKPKCVIKGNILRGNKYYRDPSCGQYKNTQVQLYLGDSWFCTEKDAKAAGFIKGTDCP